MRPRRGCNELRLCASSSREEFESPPLGPVVFMPHNADAPLEARRDGKRVPWRGKRAPRLADGVGGEAVAGGL